MQKPLILTASLLCSACAMSPQVERATIDYNQAVANSANELTFLNVLRAMERYPLHFTSISNINGSFKVSAGGTLGGSIVENGGSRNFGATGEGTGRTVTLGAETVTPSLTTEISGGPNFDIGVLDTQEFYSGILRSVEPAVAANFINMGWPDDLLTALLVERIEFHIPKQEDVREERKDEKASLRKIMGPHEYGTETIWRLDNRPGNLEFERFLRCFRLRPRSKTGSAQDLLPLSALKKPQLSDLLLLDGEKLSLSGEMVNGSPVIQRNGSTAKGIGLLEVKHRGHECGFELVPEGQRHQPTRVSIDIYYAAKDAAQKKKSGTEAETEAKPVDHEHTKAGGDELVVELTPEGKQDDTGDRDDVRTNVVIVLRSAHRLLHFLGEYARASLLNQPRYRLPRGPGDQEDQEVITVRRGREPGAFLTARLNGVTYSVPGNPERHGRTPIAIDLAQQLVNLQKSAKDKPVTETVRLIN